MLYLYCIYIISIHNCCQRSLIDRFITTCIIQRNLNFILYSSYILINVSSIHLAMVIAQCRVKNIQFFVISSLQDCTLYWWELLVGDIGSYLEDIIPREQAHSSSNAIAKFTSVYITLDYSVPFSMNWNYQMKLSMLHVSIGKNWTIPAVLLS